MPIDHAALFDRAAVGTFDQVYDAHFAYVYRIVARLLGRRDVEDVVQEVFLVVHRKLPTFEGRAAITTWLFSICHRVVGAHVRKERMQRLFFDVFRGSAAEIPSPLDPLQVMEQEEVRARVASTLARLSFKKRAVLVMFELEGWSCAEIAGALGIPVDTVYTRLHHARRDFAFLLTPHEGDER
jgi:RNA polymerase sigma-70 factor (ECF subfamily)